MKTFTDDNLPAQYTLVVAVREVSKACNIKRGDVVLCLGEIPNMKGHVVIADSKGHIFWGFHADNFRYAREDEI